MATRKSAPSSKTASTSASKKTVAVTATPAAVEAPETSVITILKKKEMIEKVAEASGVKRVDAKKAMEATLKILGDALQEGTEVNVPPLGRISVNRQKEASGAHVIIAKLRRSKSMLSDAPNESDTAERDAAETAGDDS